jgi:hypothetical protein
MSQTNYNPEQRLTHIDVKVSSATANNQVISLKVALDTSFIALVRIFSGGATRDISG